MAALRETHSSVCIMIATGDEEVEAWCFQTTDTGEGRSCERWVHIFARDKNVH